MASYNRLDKANYKRHAWPAIPAWADMRSLQRIAQRRWWQLIASLTGAVLVAGALAPFINASVFSARIQQALQMSLGRPVTFGAVHFTLFSGPGFSLEDVSIDEDPKFGLEQFASVPKLQARIRVLSLVRGRLAFSSLRMDDPTLNIVKSGDGTWNVVELVARLTAPSRLPLDVFPAFSISGGRLNFKLGSRKSMLYVNDTDVSLYPERSGKLYVQFSGSPARSDRAGNGFGHIRGTANWYVQPSSPSANQLELNVTLDPSNLSEVTTLIEGQDAGVHGTIGSHARVEGPLSALRVNGDLELSDVHRWDLTPTNAGAMQGRYYGTIDLQQHTLALQTSPPRSGRDSAIAFRLQVNDLLAAPDWAVVTLLREAPASDLLPLSRRLGIPIPEDLKLSGAVTGAVSYAPQRGFSGAVNLQGFTAELPNLPALRTAQLTATVDSGVVRVAPVEIEAESSGSIQVGGQYDMGLRRIAVSLHPVDFSAEAMKDTAAVWFGAPSASSIIQHAVITGDIEYTHKEGEDPAWSGQLQFSDAQVSPPGIAQPLTDARGRVSFAPDTLTIERLSAILAHHAITGSYRYDGRAKESERLQLSIDAADLRDIEMVLDPTLESHDLLARLGVAQRPIPSWLASRHMHADVSVDEFSVNGTSLGSLRTRLLWTGPHIDVLSCDVSMPQGSLHARGSLNVRTNVPQYRFTAAANGIRWRGGVLNGEGTFETFGLNTAALQHLRAEGTFSGQDVSATSDDLLNQVSGAFQFSFAEGWPDLKLSRVQADQGDEAWTGTGASQSDGTLVLELEREGRQRRVVSSMQPDGSLDNPGLSGRTHSR